MLITLARKPLTGSVAVNALQHGCGALNVGACRIEAGERPLLEHTGRTGAIYGSGLEGSKSIGTTTQGRWPANVLHDGSEAVVAGFPDTGKSAGGRIGKKAQGTVLNVPAGRYEAGDPGYGDSGSAARFFKQVKVAE